jgi:hypothetical protein
MTSAQPTRNRYGVALLLLVGAALLFLVVLLILRGTGDRSAVGHSLLILAAVVIAATGAGILASRR